VFEFAKFVDFACFSVVFHTGERQTNCDSRRLAWRQEGRFARRAARWRADVDRQQKIGEGGEERHVPLRRTLVWLVLTLVQAA
jgi:hypothetical protein